MELAACLSRIKHAVVADASGRSTTTTPSRPLLLVGTPRTYFDTRT